MATKAAAGPRNAKTDERSGIRTYKWKGRDLPSVTSLRRLLGVPFPLATWMVEQVVKAAVNNSVALDAQVAEEGPDVAGKWLRTLGTSERDAAANRGTAVHEAAASGRAVMHVEPELQGPLSQFYDFITVTGAKIILQEQQVWNLTLGYAGSLDIGIEIEWGGVLRRLVVDIKTGKAVYVDHVLQLMGYGLGEFVGKDDVEDAKATKWLHSADGLAVLHLSDTEWELIEVKVNPEIYEVFKAMVTFAHWQMATPTIDTLIKGRWTK